MSKRRHTTTRSRASDAGIFIDRDMSWIEFNFRVLGEACCAAVPLLERARFLGICGSNLDEFFMVRMPGVAPPDHTADNGESAVAGRQGQFDAITSRVRQFVLEHTASVRELLSELAAEGIAIVSSQSLTNEDTTALRSFFASQVEPLLSPLAVDNLDPFPVLPGLTIHIAALIRNAATDTEHIAVVSIPQRLPPLVRLPSAAGVRFALIEDAVRLNMDRLFTGYSLADTAVFRLTRDADITLVDEDVADLAETVVSQVRSRRSRDVVRVELSAHAPEAIRQWLCSYCGVGPAHVYEIDGMIDRVALMYVADIAGRDDLRNVPWPPSQPQELASAEDIFDVLRDRDTLLCHPYESFEPVIGLLNAAAADPEVLAIKQTLYRTSADSPVIVALVEAAERGKQVTVLVELKARFDEVRNIGWARRLEDAGCHVVYGIAGYKTHVKALLILRREPAGIRRYLHLATGNYNERTARLYSDIGLLTTDSAMANDVAALFNLLTGYSQQVGWQCMAVSPLTLKTSLLDSIEREIRMAASGRKGLIMAKMNSLQDPDICRALCQAGTAGVTVLLNIRGICCIKPGIKGVSDNIRVMSIIDRYLEHARICYFHNGGHQEVFLSSADWMERNLMRRFEIMFPVQQTDLKARLISMLETYFADNTKSWTLDADGHWHRVRPSGDPVRAQQTIYEDIHRGSGSSLRLPEFRPLTPHRNGRDNGHVPPTRQAD